MWTVSTPWASDSVVPAPDRTGLWMFSGKRRMQQGSNNDVARIVATIIGGFLLAGLQLFHSILDSLLIFAAIYSGVDITYGIRDGTLPGD